MKEGSFLNEYLKVFGYVYEQVKKKKGYWRKASKSQIFWRVKYDEPQNRYYRDAYIGGGKVEDLTPQRKKEIVKILDFLVEKGYLRTVEVKKGNDAHGLYGGSPEIAEETYIAYKLTNFGKERYKKAIHSIIDKKGGKTC